jgi:hypothetical protein
MPCDTPDVERSVEFSVDEVTGATEMDELIEIRVA